MLRCAFCNTEIKDFERMRNVDFYNTCKAHKDLSELDPFEKMPRKLKRKIKQVLNIQYGKHVRR